MRKFTTTSLFNFPGFSKLLKTVASGLLFFLVLSSWSFGQTVILNNHGSDFFTSWCIGSATWTPHEFDIIFPAQWHGQAIQNPILYYRMWDGSDNTTLSTGSFTTGDNGPTVPGMTPVLSQRVNSFVPPGISVSPQKYYIFDFTGQVLNVPSNGVLWFRFDATSGSCSAAAGTESGSSTYTTTYQQANNVRPGGVPFSINGSAATCATPTNVTATPSSICAGAGSNLNATSAGNTIRWYSAATGGTFYGSSTSGSNFFVNPSSTTTYYAEAVGTATSGSQTFNYSGGVQTFTVPSGVTSINVDVIGARGGTSYPAITSGGYGGRVTGTISVTPGQVLQIYVGGAGADGSSSGSAALGGFNGGGNGGFNSTYHAGGGGGGASDIRVSPYGTSQRLVVAAGGGGGAYNYGTANYDRGGHGGGTTGEDGSSGNVVGGTVPGKGGTPSSGGLQGNWSGYCTSQDGGFGFGGASGTCGNGGGGGGGGWYGGGGSTWGGGGGGSNYLPSGSHTRGYQNGNGVVYLSWTGTACSASSRVPVTVTVVPVGATASVISNVSCNGLPDGSATVTPSGIGPFSYTWSNGETSQTATHLSAGTNTVTVADACGHTITRSVTISQPSAVSLTATVTPVSCNGSCDGSVILSASGGSGSYTFTEFSHGFDGTSINSSLFVRDNIAVYSQNNELITSYTPGGNWDKYFYTNQTFARIPGKTFSFRYYNGSNNWNMIGWHGNGSTAGSTSRYTDMIYALYFHSSGLQIYEDGAYRGDFTSLIGGGWAANTWYDCKIVLKSAGADYYIRKAGQTNYTLLYSSGYSNETNIRAGFTYLRYNDVRTDDWNISGGGGATFTPPLTGLCAGTYTFSVQDANGCSATTTATITQPSPLNITTSVTNTSCIGVCNGSVTVNGSGGTGPYTVSGVPSLTDHFSGNDQGLILHLTFDEGTNDRSPSNLPAGTNNGGITFNNGTADFGNNITRSISMGTYGPGFLTEETTISFWIKSNDRAVPARQNPIDHSYGGWGTMTLETDGTINWYFGNSGVNAQSYGSHGSGSNLVTNGTWIHVTAVRDPSNHTYTWYKNGSYYTSGTYDASYPVILNNALTIGDGYVNSVNGEMDDFRVYNRPLSAAEVQDLYQRSFHDYFYSQGIVYHNNGQLTFNNQANGWDFNYFTTQTYTRSTGLTFQGQVYNTGGYVMMGWHDGVTTGNSYANLVHAIYQRNDGTLAVYEDGAYRGDFGSSLLNTWYDFKIELKSSGALYYWKQSNTPNWTLLYNSTYSSQSNLRLGITPYSPNSIVTDNWLLTGAAPATTNLCAGNYTFTVTDANGCSASANVTVGTNPDNTNPTISCPASITVNTATGQCSANVNYSTPSASDNCPGVNLTLINGLSSGSSFPEGTTTVTWQAADASGNTANCSFNVTVNDNQNPSLTCPANISVNTANGQCQANVTVPPPTVSDNCPGTALSFDGGNDYLVANASTNLNNAAVAYTVEFWVRPNGPPNETWKGLIGKPGRNYNVWLNNAGYIHHRFHSTSSTNDGAPNTPGGSIPWSTWSHVAITNNGSTANTYINGVLQASGPVTGTMVADNSPLYIGRNLDGSGGNYFNGDMDEIRIWNYARTNAQIITTMNIPLSGSESGLVAYYNLNDGPGSSTALDKTGNGNSASLQSFNTNTAWIPSTASVSGVVVTNNFNGTANASGTYPKGTTTVVWTATDASGNSVSCNQTITVVDNQNPTIACPANISVNSANGQCAATVNYSTPTASDNCPGVTVALFSGPASGSSFSVGTTPVTWRATDAAGHTANCSFNVTVVDNQNPTIACPANISVNAANGQCAATVNYSTPTASDNCPGVTVALFSGPASGSSFSVGTTPVTWRATDAAGHTANCSFNVTVVDNQNPTIACPANISVNAASGQCAATVNYSTPTASDNCPGVTVALFSGPASGSSFSVGTTPVTWRATDAAGHTANCTFNVTVVDNQNPTIACPANISVNAATGQCAATVNYSTPTASDNCPGVTVALFSGPASGSSFSVGTTPVTWRATDAAGHTANCSFNVTVVDNQNPTIACPANISVNAASGQCAATVNYSTPTASDNCPGVTVALFSGPASGSSFSVGTTPVTWRATDAAGHTANCSFNVTVVDNQNPTIACPANISVNAATGQCAATVNYSTPTASDNCPGVTVALFSGPASGSSFSVGTTPVTWRATDAAGHTANCSFNVTVVDNQNPTIACPANISVNAATGQCAATVNYSTPTASDNCPGVTVALFSGPASGSSFSVGTTPVTWRATDAAGHTANCSFNVTVVDNQNPTIACPANISVNAASGQCAATVNYSTPTASDNCPGVTVALFSGPASGSSFSVGTTPVTWRATDAAGHTANCSFNVTVVDNQNPTIACPANISVNAASGQCAATVNYSTPTASDNCPGVTVALFSGPASGSSFSVGTTPVTWRATDAAGHTANCSFNVTVVDNQNPTIACPANISVNAASGQCAATVNYSTPTASDNCPGVTVALFSGPASGSSFSVGTTPVTWRATDAAGHTANCSFNVTVVDNQNPTIACPANISVNAASGQCAATVNYSTPTASDNCPGVTVALFSGPASGSSFSVGTTPVTWRATDAAGHTANCSFNVTVVENQNPTIACPANISVNAANGQCAATVNYSTPTASDNCPGVTVALFSGPASGSSFSVGTTPVTWRATDAAGHTANCSFNVTVVDNQNPTIACPANISVNAANGQCAATVNYSTPTASDNCPGVTVALFSGPASGSSFSVGTTPVTWRATDAAGHTANCSFNVTVVDNQNPTIACPANISVNAANGQCAATVNYSTPTASDNCPGVTVALFSGPASGSSFSVGTTPVTWRATDAAGHTANCTFNVTVVDNQNPTIACPANQTLVATSPAGATGSYTAPVGTDNCPGSTTAFTSGLPSGSTFPIGTTTVSYTVTDAAGNTATCSFTITVSGVAPSIVCPGNITVNNDAGQCSAVVNFAATDGVGIPPSTITYSQNPGTSFNVGSTTVTATATNAVGSSSCTFSVTVLDNENPAISCPGNITVNSGVNNSACSNSLSATGLLNMPGVTFPTGPLTTQGNSLFIPATGPNDVKVVVPIVPAGLFQAGDPITLDFTSIWTRTIIDTDVRWVFTDGNQNQVAGVLLADNSGGEIYKAEGPYTAGGTTVPFQISNNVSCGNCFPPIGGQYTADVTLNVSALGAVSIDAIMGGQGSTNTAVVTYNFPITFDVSQGINILFVREDNNPAATYLLDSLAFKCNLATPGSCGAIVSWANPVATDNCSATVSRSNGPGNIANTTLLNGDEFPVGTTTVCYQATDPAGNSDECCFTVTVVDNENPEITCPANITVNNDLGVCGAAVSYVVTASDNCPGQSVSQSAGLASGAVFPIGNTTNTFTATDASGNTASCTFHVVVIDNENPVINCPANIAVSTDFGVCGANVSYLVTASDNCPGQTVAQNGGLGSGALYPVGTTVNSFTVTDANGNTASCTFNVAVSDNELPVALCQNVTVQLNASGNGSTTANAVNNGSSDACGIASLTLSTTTFGCSNVGANAVTLTVTDNNGNSSSCSANVTVQDNIAPVALCQNLTLQLDAQGNASITAQDLDNGSSDACGIATYSISQSTFTCQSVITNNVVTLTVVDNNGNSSNCTGTVSILDTVPPVAVCQDITIQLDNNGNASITPQDVDGGTNDACGVASLSLGTGQNLFDCSSVGPNTVTLTASDVNGNSSTCTATVTVVDQIPPLALCQDITVSLDATGNVSIAGGQVDGGSTDNCTIQFITVSPPNTFDCNNIGANVVTLAVVDVNNNYSICTANVTIEDNTPPVAICKDITVQLSSGGTVSIAGQDVDNSSTDACGIQSYVVSPSSFDCSDQGSNPVTLTVTDVNGNSSTCSASVRVEDNVDPIAICQDVTVQLDANGNASTTAQAVDNGSNDACGIVNLSLDVTSFDCSNLGANQVTLTVTDGSTTGGGGGGGQQLDQSQTTTTTRKATLWQSFTAGVTGQLTQIDLIMHASSTTNTKNLTIYAGAGTGGTQLSGPQTLTFSTNSVFESFTLSTPIPVVAGQVYTISLVGFTSTRISYAAGTNPYAGGEMDVVGGLDDLAFRTYVTTSGGSNGNSPNTATCTATVTVQDTIPPTINCPPTQNLIATSAAGATATFTNPVGSDNCPSTTAQTAGLPSGSTFPIGSTTNTFTVTDASGNTASCSFDINVVGVPPAIVCPADITVNTTAGQCDGVATYIATDPVGIPASTITYTIAPGSTFPLGSTSVTATATNSVGSSSCSFIVTVEDHEAPVALCQDLTIQLSAGTNNGDGAASITATQVDNGSNDACGIASLVLDNTSFDCSNVSTSPNTVTLTVTDNNGNQSTCTAGITVEDNVPPVAICQDLTIQLSAGTNNGDGAASITPQQVDNGSSDNCTVASLALDNTSFDCSDVSTSPNTVTLTVTDVNGNQSTCTAGITVQDNVPPVAICQDLTIQLSAGTNNGDGAASITPQQVDNGSSDNCSVANLALNNTSFDCSDVSTSPNTVTLTVTDVNGNQSTCTAGITVQDNVPPVALCQNLTIQLNAGTNNGDGSASITPQQVDNGSSDNCSVANLALDNTSFDCSDVSTSPNTVTLTVTDVNGNQSTCTAGITVEDNVPPVALCQDLTIQLSAGTNNGDGAASITTQQVDNGSSDNCSVASLALDNTSFDCSDVSTSPNTVTLTVTDVNGNQSTCTAGITVEDNVPPAALCQDLTIQLSAGTNNGDGAASITPQQVDNGSSDNCSVANLALDNTSFDCSDVSTSPNTVTLTVTDVNGNQSTCTAGITVEDNVPPVAICQDLTIQLSAGTNNGDGAASITPQQVNNGSSDNCSVANLALDNTSFDCSDVSTSPNTVTLTVTDVNGNQSTCTAGITVEDNVPPVAICQDLTIQLSAGTNNGDGAASITPQQVDNGSSDNCTVASLALNNTSFSCADVSTSPNTVTLTVTDVNGNQTTCTAGITVEDNVPPVALCQDLTIQLSAGTNNGDGSASITPQQVDNGSSDNCTVASLALDNTSFSCSDVSTSPNTVALTVTDVNGNQSTCTAGITVQDNVPPVAICQDLTIQLSAGTNNGDGAASITPQQVDNGSSDNCSVANLALDNTSFDCSDVSTSPNTVTLTVTDVNGNQSTCTAGITVEDNVPPVALCQDLTIQLSAGTNNGDGAASITPQQVDNGSSDNCSVANLALDNTSFDCSDVSTSPNTVTLTVTDVNGNQSTCTAGITVEDNVPPVAICQDLTIQLSAGTNNGDGAASITPQQVDNGSSDNCTVASLALDNTSFDCSDVSTSPNTVTLTVTDVNGNQSTCTAGITVQDNVPPVALCQNLTIQLNAGTNNGDGSASITPQQVDNGSSDNCSVANLALDNTSFDCSDVSTSPNSVTLTVTDVNGNQSTCTAGITVEDNVPPVALCQDLTIQLSAGTNNGDGAASITPQQVDNGSSDNCTVASLALDNTSFNCGDVSTSPNTVTLTVTDVNGNQSTCTAGITVEDNVPPVAICQDLTIQLSAGTNNGDGAASITPQQVDNGSSDNCSVANLALDNTSFDCSDVSTSPNTVTLTVTDVNGNQSTCTAGITVEDNVPPVALCQDLTIQLSAGTNNGDGAASITTQQVDNGSSDNCSVASLALDNTSFDCSDVSTSPNTVTLTVTDVNGNQSTCTAGITVEDNVPPAALCQDLTIQLSAGTNNGDGAASITPQQVDNGSSDNCSVASLSLDNTSFDCSDVSTSPNTVTLTVTDVNGNQSTCTAGITVQDNIPPVALCQDLTIQLSAGTNNGDGAASITPQQVDNGSSDNCSVANLALDNTSFDCSDVSTSPNTVTLTVTDVNGNQSTCTAGITVQDNVPPVALCQDLTIQLSAGTNNGDGAASITPQQVDNGSSDNCSIANLALDNTSFDCSDVSTSPNTVTLTVTDVNGNQSTCTAGITVEDNVPPVALCQDLTIQLSAGTNNGDGAASITPQQVDNGSSDNCTVASLALDNTSFDCSDVSTSPNTVTLTVTDVNGNQSTCTAGITVEDNVPPVALCQDLTIQLSAGTNNGDGAASITPQQVDNGSSDNCTVASLALDNTSFSCSDVSTSPNTVTLTVTDVNGNQSTCTAGITVEDNVPPVALCQYLTIQLSAGTNNGDGAASITPQQVDNGSSDNCSVANLALDNTSFDCSDVSTSPNTVTLTVTDVNGNQSTCTAGITVEDNVPPVAICQDLTIQLSAGTNNGDGAASITPQQVDNGSSDNCTVASLALDNTSFSCADVSTSPNTVTLTVTDVNGNQSTCTAGITVEDNIAPIALCQDLTINTDSTGLVAITPQQIDNGSSDNCTVASLAVNPNTFDCNDKGQNPVVLTVTDVNGNVSTCNATVTVTNDPLVCSTTSPTFACGYNISCNGQTDGQATVSVTGGCLPYNYLWTDGQLTATAINLAAGTYSVTVTDGVGDQTTCSITLTEPAQLVDGSTIPTFACGYNVSCNGASDGSIDYSLSGGCQPYTYSWTGPNGYTFSGQDPQNIAAGTYNVTATDQNGCFVTNSFTLTEPALLNGSSVIPTYACGYNISCNGNSDGSIDYSMTGGCQPYSYSWSGPNGFTATSQDISNLVAGTYTVTTTDANGCSLTQSFTLTQPAVMQITSLVPSVYAGGYNIGCNGGANGKITVNIAGGASCQAYTVTLSGPVSGTQTGGTPRIFTGLTAGTYTVTVTDANGCTDVSTITLTQAPPLSVDAGVDRLVILNTPFLCPTITAIPTGGVAPYSYYWFRLPSPLPFLNGQTMIDCPTTTTTYVVRIKDANSCVAFDTVVVNVIQRNAVGNPDCDTLGFKFCFFETCTDTCIRTGNVIDSLASYTIQGNCLGDCDNCGPCANQGSKVAMPEEDGQGNSAASAEFLTNEPTFEAFPNPFEEKTTLRFTLPKEDQVTVLVFDLRGELVGTLFDGQVEANERTEVTFQPEHVTEGVYISKLVTGSGAVFYRKLILVR
ncbi:MAG: HYR domain-containing protein [Bacteroidia bacterium]|nr:HYR domain-containing protein [Bacteroidia bacterium]